MNNQEIVGMNSAYEHAKQCSYGANMSISAALVVDMGKRIAELEKTCKSRSDTIIEYSNKIAKLEVKLTSANNIIKIMYMEQGK